MMIRRFLAIFFIFALGISSTLVLQSQKKQNSLFNMDALAQFQSYSIGMMQDAYSVAYANLPQSRSQAQNNADFIFPYTNFFNVISYNGEYQAIFFVKPSEMFLEESFNKENNKTTKKEKLGARLPRN
jgi:hypothetical protein